MAKYECVCIIRTDIGEEQVNATVDYIRQTLERYGAEIISDKHWGVRRLAYEIKKQRDGFYTMFVLTMKPDGAAIAEIRRLFKTNETILRTAIIDVPPIADKARKLAEERAKKAAEKAAKEAEARAAREAAEAEARVAKEAEEAKAVAEAQAAGENETADVGAADAAAADAVPSDAEAPAAPAVAAEAPVVMEPEPAAVEPEPNPAAASKPAPAEAENTESV